MLKSPNVKEEPPASNLEDLVEETKQDTGTYKLFLESSGFLTQILEKKVFWLRGHWSP